MAAKYGKGYSYDLSNLMASIKKGCEEAMDDTCKELLKGIQDIVISDIYAQPPMTDRYEKTGQTETSWTYECDGLDAIFYMNGDEVIRIPRIGQHTQFYGNDAQNNYLNAIGKAPNHGDVLFHIRQYIRNNFQKIYIQKCKEKGLSIR